MEKYVKSLCWNITEKCNEQCQFCYRKKCPDNSLEENIRIVDNISQVPIGKISFCGGEPILYDDLFTLVSYIKKKSPNTQLSITTNGKCIDDDILRDIIKYFDWLSFSIDSSKPEINELIGRGYNHLDKVIKLLEKCHNLIKIKINTVATKINQDDLEEIYNIISCYDIARWKIFRFFPIRDAINYRDLFYLSNQESKNIQKIANNFNEISPFKIEYNDFEGEVSCLSIQPDGTVENSNNEVAGNLLVMPFSKIIEIKRLELLKYHK